MDRSLDPRAGDVVVVDVDGDRPFKSWSTRVGNPHLAFANPPYPEFALPGDAVIEVWGVVASSNCPRRRAHR